MSNPGSRVPDAWPRGMQLEVVAAYVGLAPSDWIELVQRGDAPKAIEIAKDRGIWYREDVDAWMDRRRERGRPSTAPFKGSANHLGPGREPPLTVAALAERWHCSGTHVHSLIRSKKLRCFKAGTLVRIPAAEVERFEQEGFGASSTSETRSRSGKPSGAPRIVVVPPK